MFRSIAIIASIVGGEYVGSYCIQYLRSIHVNHTQCASLMSTFRSHSCGLRPLYEAREILIDEDVLRGCSWCSSTIGLLGSIESFEGRRSGEI